MHGNIRTCIVNASLQLISTSRRPSAGSRQIKTSLSYLVAVRPNSGHPRMSGSSLLQKVQRGEVVVSFVSP